MNKEAIEMQYLLGKLSNSDATQLEERYFVEDGVFEEIETAEDELIDAYVRGSLATEDRKVFENSLSRSPRLAERVEFARLLSNVASPSQVVSPEPAKESWWQSLFAFSWMQNPALRGAVAVALFLVVLGTPTAFLWLRVRDERRLTAERTALEQQRQQLAQQLSDQQSKTNQLAADLQNSQAEEQRLAQQLQATKDELARNETQTFVPASIFLFPTSSRGSGNRDLIVPSNATTIQLKLVLESDDHASYEATITTRDDREILKRRVKPSRSGKARIIVLSFPARLVSSGEYAVSVNGLTPSGTYESVADYTLRVTKK
jgi:hypothetical protein